MRELETTGQRPDGQAPLRGLRAGAEVAFPAPAGELSEAQHGVGGSDRKAGAVAFVGIDGPGGIVTRPAREFSVTVPIRTINPLNKREHWRARAARVRKEREATAWVLSDQRRPMLPVVVHMTRIAPSNGLDDDSLPASCKGIRDEIAKWLGVDDRDPRVKWRYQQRRGPWSVEVQIHEA